MTERTKRPPKAAKAIADGSTQIKTPKPAKPGKAVPVAAVTTDVKLEKHKKEKMVRDSFTMPGNDYAQLAMIKERCLKSSVNAKKSEVLRAALKCLASLSDIELTKAITDLDFIKTGRPSKNA